MVKINPRNYDKIIAYTSHHPHLIAVALVKSNLLPIETDKFIAGGFKDITIIVESNAFLWAQLLSCNDENIVHELEIFEEKIKVIKNALIEKNEAAINVEFKSTGIRRRGLAE